MNESRRGPKRIHASRCACKQMCMQADVHARLLLLVHLADLAPVGPGSLRESLVVCLHTEQRFGLIAESLCLSGEQ